MDLITNTDELKRFCESVSTAPFVTVDTEFMREKTYYSQLCLVQVASSTTNALIDPLAKGIDLQPLLELMANKNVLKVFHAARQDIEILYRLMGEVPRPLYDTQIAAMAAGFGDQIGYEPLVRELTGKQVDKGSRFTDWSKRPLSEKQLTYALGDVTHLIDVYQALEQTLAKDGRNHWVAEEMNALLDPSLYHVVPENAWKRLKLRHVRPKEIGIVMEVSAWREIEAQKRDMPRSRILKDDAIPELARAAPSSVEELGALRGIPNGFERSRQAHSLLEAVARGAALPKEDLPILEKPKQREQAPIDVVDLLRVLLKRQSERHGVAPKLLASAADLEAIALSDDADVPAMKGWRREVFGELAVQLKSGNLALGLDGTSVTLIERQS